LGLVFAYLLLNGQHLYGFDDIDIANNILADKQVNIGSKFKIGFEKLQKIITIWCATESN
jgi:hypothetical protein